MSERDKLMAELNNGQKPAEDLPAWLTSALGLDAVGRTVVGAIVFGRGTTARVDVLLSGDEKLIFERFGDIAKPSSLAANLVTQVGVVKTFKGTEAAHVAAALFRLAKHHRESTADDAAREWAIEHLRLAPVIELDLGDQADRWRAFSELARMNPARDGAEDRSAHTYAQVSTVLVDRDTTLRLVRTGWFHGYVRREVGGLYSPGALIAQMEAVGWNRRNSEGRVKATSPTDGRSLSFKFYDVEAGWEAQVPGGSHSYARAHTRARAAQEEPVGTGNPEQDDLAERGEQIARRNTDVHGGFER
jgi:hypothetical protein